MTQKKASPNGGPRHLLAYAILAFSALGITALAIGAILVDKENTMTIFNVVLPVLASWVGTILAFYFGRENFESANRQVRDMVERLTPEQRAKASVTSIMRRLGDIAFVEIPAGGDDGDVRLKDLRARFGGKISRLPILSSGKVPRYMIHESAADKHLVAGGDDEDTLATLVTSCTKGGRGLGLGESFVVVAEDATLAAAKEALEKVPSCQDVFITRGGSPDEPLTGWISNVRMAKFFEV